MDRHQVKPALGRPRSQQAMEAVLTAVRQLLQTSAYKELTMEGIAKAAGVGKPTLYRWWPNIASIVMDMMTQQAHHDIGVPDTGSLESDLLLYIGDTCRSLTQGAGGIMRSLMAEAQFDDGFAQIFRESFISSRRATLIALLQRGAARGELQEGADLELLADLCYGPIWYRLLNGHASLDEPFVQAITAHIIMRG
ncbi:TetR/AcrR family transcriptional regulator [Cohnella sp. REN36]|uniref:TetR/AcrR family transcriptional regulator n=1 Tax=Cohnella sp. REN36 TaxID=2887347 RepID=UPI001D13D8F3|nr:TetR/AcrR family transcriptional regulator [Cohnella sp. REN36]MCC3374146.1 TetR/AcrR family transcriptional regulator [Cohnella sp. REN36]